MKTTQNAPRAQAAEPLRAEAPAGGKPILVRALMKEGLLA
jgi:hypothetical protein